MRSLKEILSSFRIKVSPKREAVKIVEEFFKERGAKITAPISVIQNGQTLKVTGDPYVSYYIKTNNEEILAYFKKTPSFSAVEKIE